MKPGRLIWISLPGYTVGLIVDGGRVVEAPPIARWTVGRDQAQVAAYFRARDALIHPCDRR